MSKKATPFAPHSFASKVEYFKEPRILLTPEVFSDMYIIVDESDLEVGWLGMVERYDDTFLIRKVFLLKQEVNSSTTELNPEAVADLGVKILDGPNGVEEIKKLRFWGHSHHTMGTSPSWQDNDQAEEFMKNGCDYFIRGIANKLGRIEFTLYLNTGIKITDVPWTIYSPVSERNRDRWKNDIKELVKEKRYSRGRWDVNLGRWIDDDDDRGTGTGGMGFGRTERYGTGRDVNYPWWMTPLQGHVKNCRCKKCVDASLEKLRSGREMD